MADRSLLDELKKRELAIICQFPCLKFHTLYFSFQTLNSLLHIQHIHDPIPTSHTKYSLIIPKQIPLPQYFPLLVWSNYASYANTYTPTLCLSREGHKCAAINAGHRDERYDNGLFINDTGIAPFPLVQYYDFGNIESCFYYMSNCIYRRKVVSSSLKFLAWCKKGVLYLFALN